MTMAKMLNCEEIASTVFELRRPKPRTQVAPNLPLPPKPQKINVSQIPQVLTKLQNIEELTIESAINYAWLLYHFCRGKRRWDPKTLFPTVDLPVLHVMGKLFSIQPTTTYTYSHAFALFLRYVRCTFPKIEKVKEITSLHLTAFIWFEGYRGMAPSTISLRITAIKHFLGKMKEDDSLLLSYAMRAIRLLFARKIKKAHPLRLVHMSKFMRKMNWDDPRDVRDAYVGYLLSAGWLRVSELTALKWKEIHFANMKECAYGPAGTFLQILEISTTKTKVAGDVIVIAAPPHFPSLRLKKLVLAYRKLFPDEAGRSPYIFRAPRNEERQMSNDCVRRIIKRIARDIGEKNWKMFSAHSGRVGGVTDAAAAGISDAFIRWFGRWDSATFYGYFQNAAFAGIKTTLKIADYTLRIEENREEPAKKQTVTSAAVDP